MDNVWGKKVKKHFFISILMESFDKNLLFRGYLISRMNKSLFEIACWPFLILDASKYILTPGYSHVCNHKHDYLG